MADAFDSYMQSLKDRIKKGARRASDRAPIGEVTDVCPTGLDVIDKFLLGCGGFPCRRMTEVFAPEGTGKSSLLYAAFREAQQRGIITHYFETERRLNRSRLESFGIDLDRLGLDEPPHLEGLLDNVMAALESVPKGAAALFGWDSFAASPTKAEIEEGLTGKAAVMDRARIMSRAIRVIADKVATSNVALVILNQIRASMNSFGNPNEPPGGNAMRFYASTRISLMGGQAVKKGAHHIGKAPVAMCVKSLFVPPFRKARLFLVYADGWSNERTLLELGRDLGIVSEETRLSAESVARISEVLDLAEWDPLKVEDVVEKLDTIGSEKPKSEAPATSKKKTKKKAGKK